MPTLTSTVLGFESKRVDTNEVSWGTQVDSSNHSQYDQHPNEIILGHRSGVDYVGAPSWVWTEYLGVMQFTGMTVGAGNQITTATLDMPFTRFYKSHRAYIYGVKNADIGVISSSNLASTQTLTTARAAFANNPEDDWVSSPMWSAPAWNNVNITSYWVPSPSVYHSIDITAILNELRQDPSFNENDPVTLVWVDEESFVGTGIDGLARTVNANSTLGFTPPEINYTVDIEGTPAPTQPTVTLANTTFSNGETVTINTTGIISPTNSLVTVGGISQTQTITTSTDSHSFTFNRGNCPNGAGTYTFVADGITYSSPITVSPGSGLAVVNLTPTSITDASLLKGLSTAILAGAMQFEYNPLSSNGHDVVISTEGVPQVSNGAGTDEITLRFWSGVEGYWGDVFTAEFQDIGYIGSNKVEPIELTTTLNTPIFISKGEDFYSVNSPSILITEADKQVVAYTNRDNTVEFTFLESGSPVNLSLVTEIQLVVGAFTFSDSVGAYTNKFRKEEGGFLEVHFGELGLPVGTHNFYFVLFTASHVQGIVWNHKEEYTVKVVSD